jgi:hypothetical protein
MACVRVSITSCGRLRAAVERLLAAGSIDALLVIFVCFVV